MSEKLDKIIESIKSLTVEEVAVLVKKLQEALGVDSSMLSGGSGPAASSDNASGGDVIKNVALKSFEASKKIAVLKAVREITGWALGEASANMGNLPIGLKAGITDKEAKEIEAKIKEAGGEVEISNT